MSAAIAPTAANAPAPASPRYDAIRARLEGQGVFLPAQPETPVVTTLEHDLGGDVGKVRGTGVAGDMQYVRTGGARAPKDVQTLLQRGFAPTDKDVQVTGCYGGPDDLIMCRPVALRDQERAMRKPSVPAATGGEAPVYDTKSKRRVPLQPT